MKILAIIGSPRKGNTYRAVRCIEENIQAMGNELGEMYREIYPADAAYWKEKGWMDQTKYYYTNAKISPVTKAVARIAVAAIMIYLKRTLFAEAGKKPAVRTAMHGGTEGSQMKGEKHELL